jgi:hypothetical protein
MEAKNPSLHLPQTGKGDGMGLNSIAMPFPRVAESASWRRRRKDLVQDKLVSGVLRLVKTPNP